LAPAGVPAPGARSGRRGRGTALAALAGVLLLGIVALVLLGGGGGSDKGDRTAGPSISRSRSDSTPTPTASPKPKPTSTPAAQETPAPAAPEPRGNDPRQLQLQAFDLNKAGKPQEALPFAKEAVRLCEGSTDVNPCGYALFEYGKALRLTGEPRQAVTVLQERLRRFPDDQRSTVEAELAEAQAAAGGKPGTGAKKDKSGNGDGEGE
ncbi:MAG TPA: tetratricopeptide repeat protein, partial [Solirubrobacteraceae bacterium]|nr:tetratricopeptide repeat protein [Solirubrobacteraceae bacterium]